MGNSNSSTKNSIDTEPSNHDGDMRRKKRVRTISFAQDYAAGDETLMGPILRKKKVCGINTNMNMNMPIPI